MRLVQRSDTGDFVLTQIDDDSIPPPYAILSHTWGADAEEVTFNDLTNNTGKDKPGYEKIWFCAEQAARDGLEYFWIDTCCINKKNNAELSHAINSMFRWYRKATRCYAYLPDVSTTSFISNRRKKLTTQWELAFRKSRWFTRGWTLQELLAPASVEFFSLEGKQLGDKSSLRQQIYEITAIPESALQGAPLSQFSDNERISWINNRQTKLKEDKAYSLLGILDVHIPPIYGEGMESAFRRLREEIAKQKKCMQDLHLTDPRDDKKRIEDTKGGLLEDSYHWILENADFRQWRDDENSRLLWIKGDPGKGKTMLLCGIINELKKSIANTDLLSYFFCQATDSRINSATAVLRGLLYLLVKQQPSLVLHIQKEHDHAGKALFENANAWVALSEIFTCILQDPSLNNTYLIVDALDECVTDLLKLLDFVAQKSCVSSRVKWIVSSRNDARIEQRLRLNNSGTRLSLELKENATQVSRAVGAYIDHCLLELPEIQHDNDLQDSVREKMRRKANGTFLWVSLVIKDLKDAISWEVLQILDEVPVELKDRRQRSELCREVLSIIITAYRPLHLQELHVLSSSHAPAQDVNQATARIVKMCGSFLTIRDDNVYIVHQSAKDFLSQEASSDLFPYGIEDVHHSISLKSIQIMSKTIQRDMYSLRELGYPAELVEPPDPDPLAAPRYACIYWIDHLSDSSLASAAASSGNLRDGGAVYEFLREKYLYWLEALSLCKSLSKGIVSIAKLKALVDGREDAAMLNELVQDAHRFIMAHKGAIENSPLQAYALALLFSPASSLVRGHFKEEELQWITIKPSNIWDPSSGACLSTLKGHSGGVRSVAFSYDLARLASASDDDTVKIWDPSSGACLSTLKGHSGWVRSVAFSYDSARLASASSDNTVKIWDPSSGACLSMLKGHSGAVWSVAFSHDSARLASASDDKTVKIWDPSSGACLQTLNITYNSKMFIWLPSEYQPSCSAVLDNTISVGVGSGRVWFVSTS
ncbi:hypothetical protein CC80DRAFT_514059 [Byssothecium circinans]|uniref:NACHT domain-containing protein n=1 Tax=Byssothecium circinans TaxID=147558 RepID=A0A6A5U3T8_9PLEO|nr:hypothetical protein CC80DRAFT_514059 [Byssothecium circinans]